MSKITFEWVENVYGQPVLVLRKSRGKLSIGEIIDVLHHENRGQLQGHYAIILNASEATREGSGWMDEIEPKGDEVELLQLLEGDICPVCQKLLPDFQYCPNCGEELNKQTGGTK